MSASEQALKCEERVGDHLKGRVDDIRRLWNAVGMTDPDLGSLYEYGLCFDYVPAGTFKGQSRGFFRWQISTGGPGDEFRFFADAARKVYRVEYWFLDWFDGACRVLHGPDRDLLVAVFDDFRETGAVAKALTDAEE